MTDGARAWVERTLIASSGRAGLLVREEGALVVGQSVVTDTKGDVGGDFGAAIHARDGGQVMVVGCFFEGNTGVGIDAADSGTSLEILNTTILGCKQSSTNEGGYGAQAGYGASLALAGCLLEGNSATSIAAFHSGTMVKVAGTAVRYTMPDANGKGGLGMQVVDGASATVDKSLIEGNSKLGIRVEDSGTKLDISSAVVRYTKPDELGEGGRGMIVCDGASATATNCLFEGNTEQGIAAWDTDTRLALAGTVVRSTAPSTSGEDGNGLQVSNGAEVKVADCLFQGNTEEGIVAWSTGTLLDVVGTLVRDTKPDSKGQYGVGLSATDGAVVGASDSLLSDNSSLGTSASGMGTELHLVGTVVRATRSNAYGEFGTGLQGGNGAFVTIDESLFEDNREAGIAGHHQGTKIQVRRSAVRRMKPSEKSRSGYAVQAANGAAVTVADSLFEGSVVLGAVSVHPNTVLDLAGTTVTDTKPNAEGGAGAGVYAAHGGALRVKGSLVQRNSLAGMLGTHAGSLAFLRGTIVRDSLSVQEGQGGVGAVMYEGARLVALFSLVRNCATSGVAADGKDAEISVENCALLEVQSGVGGVGGVYQTMGDGVLAKDGGVAKIASSVIAQNARAGLYFHEAGGGIYGSIIEGNASYGLALFDAAEKVDFSDSTNYIFGNAFDLPEDKAVQVTSDPGDMPVPDLPEMLELPDLPEWDEGGNR